MKWIIKTTNEFDPLTNDFQSISTDIIINGLEYHTSTPATDPNIIMEVTSWLQALLESPNPDIKYKAQQIALEMVKLQGVKEYLSKL